MNLCPARVCRSGAQSRAGAEKVTDAPREPEWSRWRTRGGVDPSPVPEGLSAWTMKMVFDVQEDEDKPLTANHLHQSTKTSK